MPDGFVNIHTHCPTGRHIELRTAGVHPWHAGTQAVEDLLPLPEGVQAIGETGLDLRCGVPFDVQLAAFRRQLVLAREAGLPVVLHCVKAFEPVMRELAACQPPGVIFHGFVGSPEQARRAVGRDCFLSFGERTFASPRTVEALRVTPLRNLFVETDDSPTPIEEMYARVAEAKGLRIEELRHTTLENYERLFGEAHER